MSPIGAAVPLRHGVVVFPAGVADRSAAIPGRGLLVAGTHHPKRDRSGSILTTAHCGVGRVLPHFRRVRFGRGGERELLRSIGKCAEAASDSSRDPLRHIRPRSSAHAGASIVPSPKACRDCGAVTNRRPSPWASNRVRVSSGRRACSGPATASGWINQSSACGFLLRLRDGIRLEGELHPLGRANQRGRRLRSGKRFLPDQTRSSSVSSGRGWTCRSRHRLR